MILVEFGHEIFSSFLETKEVITVSDFSKHFYENNTNFRKYLEFPCWSDFECLYFGDILKRRIMAQIRW